MRNTLANVNMLSTFSCRVGASIQMRIDLIEEKQSVGALVQPYASARRREWTSSTVSAARQMMATGKITQLSMSQPQAL